MRSVWWGIYFVFSVIVYVFFMAEAFRGILFFNTAVIGSVLVESIGIVGLYLYVLNKPVKSKRFWMVFFWIIIAKLLLDFINPEALLIEFEAAAGVNSRVVSIASLFLGLALAAPSYYAIYQLGYSNKEQTKPSFRKKRK